MKHATNIPASIRQRLLNHARKTGVDFQRVLVRYAIERLLYRLSLHESRDRFCLKGAMLFLVWPIASPRPTGDLDLLGRGSSDSEQMRALFAEICAIEDASDGLSFDFASFRVDTLREEQEYEGLRIHVNATLAGARIPLQIDLGFGDRVHPEPRVIDFPCILPELRSPHILAYPKETVVAEKFEAMIRYAEAISRVKDLHDIRMISQTFDFEKTTLAEAIAGTLRRRRTDFPTETPYALSPPFANDPQKVRLWEAFLRRSAPADEGLPLGAVVDDLRRFLGPVMIHLSRPDRALGTWTPLTGWSA